MAKNKIIAISFLALLVLSGLTIAIMFLKLPSEHAGPINYIEKLIKMAEENNPKATHLLALEYEKGKLSPQDFQKAREWLEKGAALGFGNAQIELARYYYHGLGGEKNLVTAKELYAKAESLADITTLHNLGLAYFNGEHIEQDYAKARELFLRITQSPDVSDELYKTETRQATRLLGYMNLKGLGTEANFNEAKKWLEIAADKGDEHAKEELIKLEQNLNQKKK